MTAIATPKQLIESLNWRYATKKFDASRRIPSDVWASLEESLILAPSSYGLQPYKFVVVSSAEVKAKLRPASWNQAQVTDCSHLVVFAIRKDMDLDWVNKFIARTAEVRGTTVESLDGYKGYIVGDLIQGPRSAIINEWAARQAYIAFGTLMTSAAVLGVDACPLEGLVPDQYDEILGLGAQGLHAIAACAVGYRDEADKYATAPKVRFSNEVMVEHR